MEPVGEPCPAAPEIEHPFTELEYVGLGTSDRAVLINRGRRE
jgi:hypothetical protein